MLKRSLIAFFLGLFLPLSILAYVSPGAPRGFVNDFASMLKLETVTQLEQNLSQFERDTKNELSVVIISSLQGEPIEDYAVKLFEEWKIGKKGSDNGLLLLISREDRQMRIEVGYGLEGDVTDIESSHIISDVLVPAFRVNDYDAGVILALERIKADIIRGAPLLSEEPQNTRSNTNSMGNIAYFGLFALITVVRILAHSKSWWLGGVLGGVASLIVGVFSGIGAGIFAGVFLVPLGFIVDYIVSKHGGGRNGGPPFIWPGGGGGSSGGGFGGFGGGRSGGGGASGSW